MNGAWFRVAYGLQKVAGAASTRVDVASSVVRTAQHGLDIAASCRSAIEAATTTHSSMPPSPQETERCQSDRVDTPTEDTTGDETTSNIRTEGLIGENQASKVQEARWNFDNADAKTSSFSESYPSYQVFAQPKVFNTIDSKATVAYSDTPKGPVHSQQLNESEEDETNRLIPEGTPVPSTRIARAFGFAQLGVGLAWGSMAEGTRRLLRQRDVDTTNDNHTASVVLNDANSDRLAASLCRMRGAALKMGQMLSIQDESLLPPTLSRALAQVRHGANAMPSYQLNRQLEEQLGQNWRDSFASFETKPFAAASIGQVHRAQLLPVDESTHQRDVVVKVQYPGVAQSIESDLSNLAMLVTWSGLAPPGLFLENVIRVGQDELKVECNYRQEMIHQQRMKQLVETDPILRDNRFVVPAVVDGLTTNQIIVSDYHPGGTIDKIANLADQAERNRIGRTILYLTMKELFEWRFMQTDPNWGNFLYDIQTRQTTLIDFGAVRAYDKEFVDGYLRIVWASANRDEATLLDQSLAMGFLTGQENDQMLRAHTLSGFTVGEPFAVPVAMTKPGEPFFDFRRSNISTRMGEHTSVFLRHRLTPPPPEVYTLHRKLAGAYMLCIKLGAVVSDARDMLGDIVERHVFEDGKANPLTGEVAPSGYLSESS